MLGNKHHGFHLYSTTTGKYIRKGLRVKQGVNASDSEVSSDGRQIAVGTMNGTNYLIDCVRGHLCKFLKHASLPTHNWSSNEKVMISVAGSCFQFQETTGNRCTQYWFLAPISQYSMDPYGTNQIAVLLNDKTVTFLNSELSQNAVKGPQKKELSLTGANIDDSLEISEENIMIFDQKGDYNGLGKKSIQELFLNSQSEELEKITIIDLSHRNLSTPAASVIARNSNG